MSSNGIVPPDFPDKMINDSVACSAMSRYLYAEDEVIQPDPDVSGIGVRVAIYMQVILNNLAALHEHNLEEAIWINGNNAVAVAAISLATGNLSRPDWPHALLLYHFVLLISSSNISYNTISNKLRQTSSFNPLIERLSVIQLVLMPFFVKLTLGVWIGILVDRRVQRYYPTINCRFGSWVINLDIKSSPLIFIGAACGFVTVAWLLLSTTFDMKKRLNAYEKLKIMGNDPETDRLQKAKILWVGDYVSPWIREQLERIIRRISAAVGRSKNRPLCTVRQLTFAWRFCVWIIFMISIEGIISANGLKGQENTWSYGQTFPMIIVIIPGAALWSIFYRHYPKWASKVQSSKGRAWVSLSIVATFLAIFIPPAIPLLQSNAEKIVLGLGGVLFLVPVFWRGFLAHRIRSQIGTAGNLAAPSSLWAIWTFNLEIGIDSHNGEES